MQQLKTELKNTFTSYWHYLALQKAVQLGVFECISNGALSLENIAYCLNLDKKPLFHLLEFLTEQSYFDKKNAQYALTEKGQILTVAHPESLRNACLLWGQEHLVAWQNLDFTLKTGKPSFEHLYKEPFFDYLQNKPEKLQNYHQAMADYARDDYANLAACVDFSAHQTVADVGGGIGVLTHIIAKTNPNTQCILFDLPAVVQLIAPSQQQGITIYSGSFFEALPFKTDAIILSRVLHDWNDEKASEILTNCKNALKPNGKIYIIEIMQNETTAHLLSLNMLAMCESFERTFDEYKNLLHRQNYHIIATKQLNTLQKILICQCNIPT